MKKLAFFIILFFLTVSYSFSQPVVARFTSLDTICTNTDLTLTNTSTGDTKWYWNFCSGNIYNTPTITNLGKIDANATPASLRINLVHDSNSTAYYAFITNMGDTSVTRVKFNGSYLDPTPVVTNINLADSITGGIVMEGIQIAYDNVTGKWIGYVVSSRSDFYHYWVGKLTRLDFGNSLDNAPVITLIDSTKGNMIFPHGVDMVRNGNDWYFFVANSQNWIRDVGTVDYMITRYYFHDSLTATPVVTKITATMLGGSTFLNSPNSVNVIQDRNGNWYGLALNSDGSFTRMIFGNSPNNNPTGEKLPKMAGISNPYDFQLLEDCNRYYAIIYNSGAGSLALAWFESMQSMPVSYTWPALGGMTGGEGISETFRIGDTLICFVINNNGTLSRVVFSGCSMAGAPPSQFTKNPTPIRYTTPGQYNVRLSVNDDKSSMCKTIYVMTPPSLDLGPDTNYCFTGNGITVSAQSGFSTYVWLPDSSSGTSKSIPGDVGKHTVTLIASIYNCGDTDSVSLIVHPNPAMQTEQPFYMQVLVHANSGTAPYQYQLNNGSFRNDSLFKDVMPGNYQITVKDANGCTVVQDVTIERIDIRIPNYFTPNGDSNHDTWYLEGIDNFPKATIKIYDRYGVLLAVYNGADFQSNMGWDGTYEGRPMPSDDYWYFIDLKDGRKPYTGHVTLKR